jgi:hypothetical protein
MNCSNLRVFLFSILLAALLSGTTLRSLISAEHPGITHTLLFKGQVSGTDEQVIVWDTRYAPARSIRGISTRPRSRSALSPAPATGKRRGNHR